MGCNRIFTRCGSEHESSCRAHDRPREIIESWEVNQTAAAKRLGLTQPRLNDLLRGRINKFSLDALMMLATKAGLSVRVKIVRPAA